MQDQQSSVQCFICHEGALQTSFLCNTSCCYQKVHISCLLEFFNHYVRNFLNHDPRRRENFEFFMRSERRENSVLLNDFVRLVDLKCPFCQRIWNPTYHSDIPTRLLTLGWFFIFNNPRTANINVEADRVSSRINNFTDMFDVMLQQIRTSPEMWERFRAAVGTDFLQPSPQVENFWRALNQHAHFSELLPSLNARQTPVLPIQHEGFLGLVNAISRNLPTDYSAACLVNSETFHYYQRLLGVPQYSPIPFAALIPELGPLNIIFGTVLAQIPERQGMRVFMLRALHRLLDDGILPPPAKLGFLLIILMQVLSGGIAGLWNSTPLILSLILLFVFTHYICICLLMGTRLMR